MNEWVHARPNALLNSLMNVCHRCCRCRSAACAANGRCDDAAAAAAEGTRGGCAGRSSPGLSTYLHTGQTHARKVHRKHIELSGAMVKRCTTRSNTHSNAYETLARVCLCPSLFSRHLPTTTTTTIPNAQTLTLCRPSVLRHVAAAPAARCVCSRLPCPGTALLAA